MVVNKGPKNIEKIKKKLQKTCNVCITCTFFKQLCHYLLFPTKKKMPCKGLDSEK